MVKIALYTRGATIATAITTANNLKINFLVLFIIHLCRYSTIKGAKINIGDKENKIFSKKLALIFNSWYYNICQWETHKHKNMLNPQKIKNKFDKLEKKIYFIVNDTVSLWG